ncbi:MAG: Heme A synthase, cytochrome oxidase biogenesis protein Cox15-CtaA [uncultured Thermomicrobiales bacterium]|uniref:Heme A synthase, cytochrome oxidase biogenesis protein Cox15-CtaA n=1 Tax=uncultured Thermomicrobiales bacterium TaxID=1645740 RepID=A0A6J4UEC5_9BACT|nr:MAG: Heme A synthase, cytochrome oxidase biogenesis protein Cox15-CtaA [uncultured Thermomicrobiales bacterium]
MDKRATWARRLAIVSAVGMLIVLLMGARVTATGSGDGCGNDWPLCHGGFLPADTFESLTEYSHRLVTGIEGIVVLATTILAWPLRKRHPEFRVLIPAMMGTLILQSLMGAAAVRWPTSPEVMATHFGISLICLASASLVAFILIDARRPDRDRTMDSGGTIAGFRWLLIATFVMSIVVAYSGAYVRHTNSELACATWPSCTGELVPRIDQTPPGIQTLHRVLAGVISLMIGGIALWAYRLRQTRPDLQALAFAALVIVFFQVIVGAIVVYSGLQLLATLAHAGLMATLFVVLSEGLRRTWPQGLRRAVRSRASLGQPATGD